MAKGIKNKLYMAIGTKLILLGVNWCRLITPYMLYACYTCYMHYNIYLKHRNNKQPEINSGTHLTLLLIPSQKYWPEN